MKSVSQPKPRKLYNTKTKEDTVHFLYKYGSMKDDILQDRGIHVYGDEAKRTICEHTSAWRVMTNMKSI